MRRSVILDAVTRLVFASIVVVALYLLFAGHNQPGGGFVAGLVVGAGIAMRYVAGGIDDVRDVTRFRPWHVLSAGLVLAVATATIPVLVGDQPLDHASVTWHLPILGTVKSGTALVFDTGVFLVVVGLVLMVFEALGDDATVPAGSDEEDLS